MRHSVCKLKKNGKMLYLTMTRSSFMLLLR
jgi:hypothetical protein